MNLSLVNMFRLLCHIRQRLHTLKLITLAYWYVQKWPYLVRTTPSMTVYWAVFKARRALKKKGEVKITICSNVISSLIKMKLLPLETQVHLCLKFSRRTTCEINLLSLCQSWDSHGSKDVDFGLLQPWRWRQCVRAKRSYLPTGPHGVTTQKTNIDFLSLIHKLEGKVNKVFGMLNHYMHRNRRLEAAIRLTGSHAWKYDVNMSNKESWTANKGWSSSMRHNRRDKYPCL
jgi:hypothetical protein